MASNADLFAPPTQEELKQARLFAPPTQEELAAVGKGGDVASRGVDKLMSGSPLLSMVHKGVREATSPEGVQELAAQALMPMVAGKAYQGARALGKMGLSALQGAAVGMTNAKTDQGVAPIASPDRLLSGGIGAATAGALDGILNKVLPGAGAKAKSYAEEKAFQATGAPKKAAQNLGAEGRQAIGRTMLDEGTVPIIGTPGRIASRVDAAKEKAGEAIGTLIKSAGDKPVIDGVELGVQLLDHPDIAQFRRTPGLEGLSGDVEKFAETLASNGNMTLDQAHKLRQAIDKGINWNKAMPDMRGKQEILAKVRTAIRDKMNDAINALEGRSKDALLRANNKYANLAQAGEHLEGRLARDAVNRSVSLTDTIAGVGGGAAGGPAGALAMGALNKAGRTVGAAMGARAADAVGSALNAGSRVAGMAARNPVALQALVGTLSGDSMTPEQVESIKLMLRQNPGLIDQIKDPKLKERARKLAGH